MQAASRTVLEAKTRVWEEFGEAIEEDNRSASKRFWQTVKAPQKGEAVLCQHCLQCGWGAVDLDWGHCRTVERNNFEDLLNPTNLPSNEEAEAGVSEVDSSITQVKVTEGCSQQVYGVRGPLLRAVRSLYDRSRSLVRIAGSKSDLFPVHMLDSGRDDVVLMASSGQDLQHVLGQFAAECEAAGMRISTSKSEAMVLDRKRVACPLQGGVERSCPSSGGVQVSRGPCSRVRERWNVRLTGRLVQRPCSYAVGVPDRRGVKKELSRKAKLSIYQVNLRFPPSPMVMNFG
ncbi:hypothetical protein L3Q82_017908 [Scortum barcoo]|uniref:Uncharacterized protein n=1 Tax=Scortum barcoo TaxID=214431 RepID=A0ACB8VLX5_9TELE|nr:hypothetical protein L3Q82_017908 [Scortum barcoo]